MTAAAAVTAQFVAGKATRDALFLTSVDFTALPVMLMAASAVSLLLAFASSRASRRITPSVLIPSLFIVSGLMFIAEWMVRSQAPSAIAVLIYLHISSVGPLLGSGFWLIASERFDPRSAKKRFGQITAAGTVGGLLGAVVAERVAAWLGAPTMLVMLAGFQFACAVLVHRLSSGVPQVAPAVVGAESPADRRSPLRVIAEAPYLRNLAALVLLGSTGAAMIDYLFKAQAVEVFGRGDNLLRFFALYYAATSLVTLVLQMSSSRVSLERFGLGLTAGTPSAALLLGSVAGLVAPGLGSLVAARGGESVFRSSLFRAGYELLYIPIPAAQKRAAKSLIDVGFDRLGDAVGGGAVRLITVALPAAAAAGILGVAAVLSLAALVAASRLTRGYIGSLETTLLHRGAGLEIDATTSHDTTASVMRSLLRRGGLDGQLGQLARPATALAGPARRTEAPIDPEMRRVLDLRSRDRERVVPVLLAEEGLTAVMVPHAIPLLAWEAVANHAIYALRKVAEERIGQLTDALLDPNQDFAVRRRLARVFSVCVSERAAYGLLSALDDVRFDVRYQAARSLNAIVDKNPRVTIDRERIFEVVLREVAVGRPVWESRHLLDGGVNEAALDHFVRDRAGASLSHVFSLLSLVLPREPLQIAFRSLHTDDDYLRGTALEYLESVLPPAIKERLWPFLEHQRPAAKSSRPADEVIADLLRSNDSIVLNLEELRRAAQTAAAAKVRQ